MDASQYSKQTSIGIGPITFTNRTIKCGKKTCTTCTEGKGHPGQWYTILASHQTTNGSRQQKYLGPRWTADDLKAKVAPMLGAPARQQFMEAVERQLTTERLTETRTAVASINKQWNDNEAELTRRLKYIADDTARWLKKTRRNDKAQRQREKQRHKSEGKRLKTELIRLNAEQRALSAKLKKG